MTTEQAVQRAGYRVVCTEDVIATRRALEVDAPGTVARGFDALREEPFLGTPDPEGNSFTMRFQNGVSARYLIASERGLVVVIELNG